MYHLERFLWSQAGTMDAWEAVLPEGRPAVGAIRADQVGKAFLSNITPTEAMSVARWLGGRLPTPSEVARLTTVRELSAIFGHAIEVESAGDRRISRLLSALRRAGVGRGSQVIPSEFGEFATEFENEPWGALFILAPSDSVGTVTGVGMDRFRSNNVGFSCVFERATGQRSEKGGEHGV